MRPDGLTLRKALEVLPRDGLGMAPVNPERREPADHLDTRIVRLLLRHHQLGEISHAHLRMALDAAVPGAADMAEHDVGNGRGGQAVNLDAEIKRRVSYVGVFVRKIKPIGTVQSERCP